MAKLVLGPVLRYVDETNATVWVETDAPCVVRVLDASAPTFCVGRHHYAIVHVSGLAPGTCTPYEVHLGDERAWPLPGSTFPPSQIQTTDADAPARIVFGSCRVSVPHEPPYVLTRDADACGREVDALRALALRMHEQPPEQWPTRLLMLGDQVYADEVSPKALEFIRSRRDVDEPPGHDVANFEEYTRLYWEAWGEPVMRWLLSTVATAMIFDDHDVHDDWNISASWLADARALGWWEDRIVGAFTTYWIYQHLGNLTPTELHTDAVLAAVRSADDAIDILREFSLRADRESESTRWSYCRDDGGVRLIVLDSRAGRVLDGEERRCMLDDAEWDWTCERLVGGHDHLIIASSLPVLLSPGVHYLEAWNEAICGGAWGRPGRWFGEKVRRGMDLEHWAAFRESFEKLTTRLCEVGAGKHGPPPASIVIVSGDVHHAYLAEVAFPRDANVRSHVYQAVCSPFRNPLGRSERRAVRFATSRAGHLVGRLLARAAGVGDPDLRWRITHGPAFDNQVATLEMDERAASLRLERTSPEDWRAPKLHRALDRVLS